jgi:hypothetical protein
VFILSGCAKLLSEEYSTVSVIVVDEHYTPVRIVPVVAGKVRTFVTHPARYLIDVEYNGIEYSISGRDTYSRYKDRIGETTNAQLRTRTYDDETVKYDIISLD